MTTTQKIIKYLAIAFALFLVISIFSIIFGLSREIISSINSDKKDSKLLEEDTTVSNNVNNIESFKRDISNDDIEIKEGEKFEVKTNDPDVKFYHENSKVKIKTDKTFSWHLSNSSRGTIIIYLPNEFNISELDLNLGAGKIDIDKIFVETLLMDLGAGTMTAKEINVYEKATINGGAGNINIYSGTINNLNLKLGAGNASIQSDLTGSNTLTTGVGKLNLGLSRSKDNYKFDISKGLGNIILNDFDVSEDILIGDGETIIKISGAVGNIIINTAE